MKINYVVMDIRRSKEVRRFDTEAEAEAFIEKTPSHEMGDRELYIRKVWTPNETRANVWRREEVDAIHHRWELISKETHVLDAASCPDERKMLALLLEDKRLSFWWKTDMQYERVYRPVVNDLHDKYYVKCCELASKIEVGHDGYEPIQPISLPLKSKNKNEA